MSARQWRWWWLLTASGLGAAVLAWGVWKWSRPGSEGRPVEGPREEWASGPLAGDEAWAEEVEDGEDVDVTERWDPGEQGWEDDLGKEGYVLWLPKLQLLGPWTDARRPFVGETELLGVKSMPHGLCLPVIGSLWLSLHWESYMGLGEGRAVADNPKLLESVLPRFESGYFREPEIDLYAPRDEKKAKGSKPVSSKSSNPPETAAVSVNMKVLTLCVGLSASACAAVQVRQVDTEWLEDCPKEARVVIEALGLGTGEPYDVGLELDFTRRQETPLFMKEGPLVARWEGAHLGPDFPRSELGRRMKGAKLYGRAKSYGHRMSVQFRELELADGRKLPICAIGYDVWGKEPGLDRWGPGSHPGVNVGNDDPKMLAALKELRPGEFPIAASTIWISFGIPFRAQWLTRR